MKYFLIALALAVASITAQEPVCGIDDDLLPHPDCTLYYQCVGGRPVERNCTDNLYFNPGLGTCDYQFNVTDCVEGTRGPLPSTTVAPTTTGEPSTEPPTTQPPTTQPPTTQPPTTQPPTTQPPTTQPPTTQPPTTQPPTTQPPTTQPPSTQEPTIQPPTTQPPTSQPPTTQAPTTTTQRPAPQCPTTGTVNIPYVGDCSLYVMCIEGVPIVYRCPLEYLFDYVSALCRPKEVAGCFDGMAKVVEVAEVSIWEYFKHPSRIFQ